MRFIHAGSPDPGMAHVRDGLDDVLRRHGHEPAATAGDADLVINHIGKGRPRPIRRGGRGVFVISVGAVHGHDHTVQKLYPLLVKTLSNLLIAVARDGSPEVAHLVTLEQAHVVVPRDPVGDGFFEKMYARIEPLATSRLVIDNIFEPDLEPALWHGDEHTASIGRAGRFLAELNLLPAAFNIEEQLSPRDFRHVQLLYGIGGLSYGNYSVRLDPARFWMSASGVDKSRLREIGRDILLVKGYDAEKNAIRLSVPPGVEPRRVSVDAIEHFLIYRENPSVGAILHVHAWLEGVPSTAMQFPCGTYELGRAVADLVAAAPDPGHAVVGQRNHGLTITGASLDEILERVGGSLVRNVPMT
ncbi:MAG TPA: class II aldolase/adducin family protein [Longimicrobiales bacterium]